MMSFCIIIQLHAHELIYDLYGGFQATYWECHLCMSQFHQCIVLAFPWMCSDFLTGCIHLLMICWLSSHRLPSQICFTFSTGINRISGRQTRQTKTKASIPSWCWCIRLSYYSSQCRNSSSSSGKYKLVLLFVSRDDDLDKTSGARRFSAVRSKMAAESYSGMERSGTCWAD